jgi:adenylosuccinate synthase
MTTEDEEFNRIEREASMRKAAVREAVSQRQWIGLTDKDIITAYETSGHKQAIRPQDVFAVASLSRAIEALLKERNT